MTSSMTSAEWRQQAATIIPVSVQILGTHFPIILDHRVATDAGEEAYGKIEFSPPAIILDRNRDDLEMFVTLFHEMLHAAVEFVPQMKAAIRGGDDRDVLERFIVSMGRLLGPSIYEMQRQHVSRTKPGTQKGS